MEENGQRSNSAPPYVAEWNLCDGFTVWQAAHLWLGQEPTDSTPFASYTSKAKPPAALQAVRQMLHGAIRAGELPAKLKYEYSGSEHNDDYVTRSDLEAFAKRKGVFPPFLFNTIVNEPDLATPIKNKGGRQATYDWNMVAAYVAYRHGEDDLSDWSLAQVANEVELFIANDYQLTNSDEPKNTPGKDYIEGQIRPLVRNIQKLMNAKKLIKT